MTGLGDNVKAQLKALVERIEKLEEDKKAIGEDIREVYTEAKGNGYDIAALRSIVRLRRKTPEERAEEQAVLDVYLQALDMQLPLFGDETP